MTVFTRTWDAAYEAIPADVDNASEGAARIRNLKSDIQERMEVDHHHAGDTDDGAHKKITLKTPIADPSNVANTGFLYLKDVSAKVELHWQDEDGNILVLTNAGAINFIPAANSIDGTMIALGSDAQGDIMYYDGTDWVALGPGTSGEFLKTLGAAANPAWAAITQVSQAVQSAIEAETNEDTYIPPDLLNFNPGVAKGWVQFDVSSNVQSSHNVASVTDTGSGDWLINWATDFSSADYGVVVSLENGGLNRDAVSKSTAAGTTQIISYVSSDGSVSETAIDWIYAVAFGDQ